MRRITVTVPDDLHDYARAEVSAGRATSVSAWVAAAMRARAVALAEIDADLDDFYRTHGPVTDEEVDELVALTGLPVDELRRFLEERTAQAHASALGEVAAGAA